MQTILIFTQFDFQSILKTTQQDPHEPLDEFTINYISTIDQQETIIEPAAQCEKNTATDAIARANYLLSVGEVAVIIGDDETHLIYKSDRQEQPKQETKLDELQPEHVHTMFEITVIEEFQAGLNLIGISLPSEPIVLGSAKALVSGDLKCMLQITEVDGDGQEFGSWTGEEFLRVVGDVKA